MCKEGCHRSKGTFNVTPQQDGDFERRRLVHWQILIDTGTPTLKALRSIEQLSAEDLAEMYPAS